MYCRICVCLSRSQAELSRSQAELGNGLKGAGHEIRRKVQSRGREVGSDGESREMMKGRLAPYKHSDAVASIRSVETWDDFVTKLSKTVGPINVMMVCNSSHRV